MEYTLPKPGQIFERDGKRREVVAVRNNWREPWVEWKRPGANYSVNGANIWTWHTWASKATEVPNA